MEHFDELLTQYALNNANYQKWRREHTKMFGSLFSSAFEDQPEAQIHLTAALINISMRDFEKAIPKLELLESLCACERDYTAIHFFNGLNYELLENEEKMNAYYQKLSPSDLPTAIPLALRPYYRTAKFAQRDSECSKSVYYYQKALSFFDGNTTDEKSRAAIGQIIYDIATIFLYMHQYDACEKYLELSKKYDQGNNQHRTYVTSILYAVQGKQAESRGLLNQMSAFLRQNCEPMVEAILAQKDPHYCVVPQSRSEYAAFWREMTLQKQALEEQISAGCTQEAQAQISRLLTAALPFMKRNLTCRIEAEGEAITVFCKNYCVKSLISEYEILLSEIPKHFQNWKFVSIKYFESYSIE
ncbi:MAG: hypothetical protein E7620_08420 [Ruminococcaceae bacterium]|nr:hypothetical protein [Oscillospiraceae bacterium]